MAQDAKTGMGVALTGDVKAAMTAWQKLGPKNQAIIEAGVWLVGGGAVTLLGQQLSAGAIDGHALLRALEAGGGLAIAAFAQYMRGHVTGLMTPTP